MKNFFAALFLLGSSSVWGASFSNENSLLIGDRSAGMGGAASAVLGDAAGASYYNPATLAFLEGSAFSAAVGIYKKFDVVYGKEEDLTTAPLRVNQGFFRSLPASTGNVIRFEKVPDWIFAFSVIVPDYEQFRGDLQNSPGNISTLSFTEESLWVGGSASRKISATEAFGVSVYYTARSFTKSLSDRSFPATDHTIVYTQEKTLVQNAIVPIVGYYREISPEWKSALTLRLPSFSMSSRATMMESLIDADANLSAVTLTSTNLPERSATVFIPAKLTLGASYQPDPSWLIAFDVSVREGKTFPEMDDYSMAVPVKFNSVVNASLGVEKQFVDWIKGRAGVYTNFSAHPNPDPTLMRAQEDRTDMLGFASNVVFVAGKQISYTFGGYYIGGRGRSIQRINQTYEVLPKTSHIFTMLMGTSFSF